MLSLREQYRDALHQLHLIEGQIAEREIELEYIHADLPEPMPNEELRLKLANRDKGLGGRTETEEQESRADNLHSRQAMEIAEFIDECHKEAEEALRGDAS